MVTEIIDGRCPHCHCFGLVPDVYSPNHKGLYCLLCSRRFKLNKHRLIRLISEEKEKKRFRISSSSFKYKQGYHKFTCNGVKVRI